MLKPSINYKIGDWILELSTKLIFEIVDTQFAYTPPPIHDEHAVIFSDYAIKCVSWSGHPKQPIGIDWQQLEAGSILVKNKELAMVLYGKG